MSLISIKMKRKIKKEFKTNNKGRRQIKLLFSLGPERHQSTEIHLFYIILYFFLFDAYFYRQSFENID